MTNTTEKSNSSNELDLNKDEKIRRSEFALKEIKNKFNEAESIAKFGFWELDPVTLNLKWTDGLFNILGYDPRMGEFDHYNENKRVIHPDDWEYFYITTKTVFDTGKSKEFDVRVIRADGTECIIHIIAKPKKDIYGKVIGVRGTAQDITELKSMEGRLRESEAFYKTLFENTGTASIIVDDDANILMANTQFENFSGYSKEELEGKINLEKMVLKEDMEIMKEYHYMRVNDVEIPPQNYEIRLINKEGKTLSALVNVALIPETKNTIISITDLTEVKRVEEILKITLKRFYTILENMHASVLLVADNDIIEFANGAFCDYFSLDESPEDLQGLSASEMLKKIKNAYRYPDYEIKQIIEVLNDSKAVIGEEIPMQGERTCLRDFVPIFVGHKLYGRLWLHYDITERKKMEKELKESERRYRYIVENATAGMFILDKNGIIKYLNWHMAQMLNFSKNEMLEKHIKVFVDENDDFCRFRKPIDTKIERYNWFKFLDKDRKIFWSNLNVSPIFNSKKEFNGCLGIVTDINMQKGLEEAFLEREEIFTDIIYDMMEMLNNVAKDKNKTEDLSLQEKLDNN